MKREISKMEKKKIEKKAIIVLNAFQYNEKKDVYVDATKLASFFGFTVSQIDSMPIFEDGSIEVSKNGTEKKIAINSCRTFQAKRFIIIHELSHYLLHYQSNNKLFRHRENIKGKDQEENDADYMAACLLMPEKSFIRKYKQYKKMHLPMIEIYLRLYYDFCTPMESIQRRIDEIC